MNKKISTAIIAVVCFILTATVAVGYMIKQGIIDTSNLFENGDDTGVSERKNNLESEDLPSNVYLGKGAECTLDLGENEKSQHRYMYYKFNSIKISKKVENFDLCNFQFEEVVDENGTITNDYSYVICNITVENKGNVDYYTSINNLWLHYGLSGDYEEARTYNSGRTRTLTKDYFCITFKPNEKHNYNLVYIAPDKKIKKYKSDLLLYSTFVEPAPNPNVTIPVIEKK